MTVPITTTDPFEYGVETTTMLPPVYIDPKDIAINPAEMGSIMFRKMFGVPIEPEQQKNLDEAIEDFKAKLDGQAPGISDSMSNDDVFRLMVQSMTSGPFAMKVDYQGDQVCIVNKPGESFDTKAEMGPALSGQHPATLGRVPGTDALWQKIVGIHEGTHCDRDSLDPSKLTLDELEVAVLQREAVADKAVIDYLKENGHHEMARAYIDYRALQSSVDPVHATSVLLDDGETIVATKEHVDAAKATVGAMLSNVSATLGIDYDDAETMLREDPKKFIETMEKVLKDGVYDGSPLLKEYTENYIGAFKRQILDEPYVAPPASEATLLTVPEPDGPALERIPGRNSTGPSLEPVLPNNGKPTLLQGDVRDNVLIGGVSASDYFARMVTGDIKPPELRPDMQPTVTTAQPAVEALVP